jgi:hypothetical protein
VRVGSAVANSAAVPGNPVISADTNDPLRVTAALAQVRTTENGKRESENEKRATGTGDGKREGGPLIEWPASTRPRFAVQRTMRDTVGGVMAGDAVVVAAFDRQWSFPPDSLRGAEVIARWVDGEPAAIEKPDGPGCVRSVAIPVTPIGDLVIRTDFVRFVASLSRPCAQVTSLIPADPAVVAKLEGKGGLAPREAFQPVTDAHSELAPWLFALAIAAAIGEVFVRRRGRDAIALGEGRSTSREARAA